MVNAGYLILVLVVAFIAIVIGFRRGITGQLASILGFGFGAVVSRVLTPELASSFGIGASWSQAPEFQEFTSSLVCAVVIYCLVYLGFSFLSPILRSAMSVFEVGMFNRLLGGFFSLLKNMLWLSMALNLFLCVSPESELLRYESANDGNLVAAVMGLTPAILGCDGAEEFAHYNQLKHAKTISCNFRSTPNVIIMVRKP